MRAILQRRIVELIHRYPRQFVGFTFGESPLPVGDPRYNFDQLGNEDLVLLFEQVVIEVYQRPA